MINKQWINLGEHGLPAPMTRSDYRPFGFQAEDDPLLTQYEKLETSFSEPHFFSVKLRSQEHAIDFPTLGQPRELSHSVKMSLNYYRNRIARENDNCFRVYLSHSTRIDCFANHLWIESTEPMDLMELTAFYEMLTDSQINGVIYRSRPHRSANEPMVSLSVGAPFPENLLAFEDGCAFELRGNQGLSSGLFLDQRLNRRWVREISVDQRVLNLFCYTGGFSVAALKGGASQVTQVDASKTYLEWAKHNVSMNTTPTTPFNGKLNSFAADCMFFLQRAVKRNEQFDLIVCDPPTFGRSKEGVFQLKKDIDRLLSLCLECLTEEGTLFFSCNAVDFTTEELQEKLSKLLKQIKKSSWTIQLPPPPLLEALEGSTQVLSAVVVNSIRSI